MDVAFLAMSGTKRLLDGMDLVKLYRANPETGAVFDPIQDAHSHWEGLWYQRPKRYPVAYFDAEGCAIFQTENELKIHGQVQVEVHFSVGLRKLHTWRPLAPAPKQYKR